jgi:hypothetical protein
MRGKVSRPRITAYFVKPRCETVACCHGRYQKASRGLLSLSGGLAPQSETYELAVVVESDLKPTGTHRDDSNTL